MVKKDDEVSLLSLLLFFKVFINIDRGKNGEAGLNSLGLKRGFL